jgi:hypothetical protein
MGLDLGALFWLDFKKMVRSVQGFEAASYFKSQDKQHHSGYRNIPAAQT